VIRASPRLGETLLEPFLQIANTFTATRSRFNSFDTISYPTDYQDKENPLATPQLSRRFKETVPLLISRDMTDRGPFSRTFRGKVLFNSASHIW
jgi:hypothetical protein